MALQDPSPIYNYVAGDALPVPGFAHQPTTPLSELYTGVRVPGQQTLPLDRLSLATESNKPPTTSNEAIVQSLAPETWNVTGWEKNIAPSDAIFVATPKPSASLKNQARTMNVAQFQSWLSSHYENIKQKVVTREGGFTSEFERAIVPVDTDVFEAMKLYRQYGEGIFTADKELSDNIAHNQKFACLIGLSQKHILDTWRFFGIYQSDSGRKPNQKRRTINCVVGGVTTVVSPWNYWDAREGDYVGFILTRVLITAASTPSKNVYGHFSLVPWCGPTPIPTCAEREYYDDAGILQLGHYFHVGEVHRNPTPDNIPTKEDCLMKCGLNCTEAVAKDVIMPKIDIMVGPRSIHTDLL